jgi:predicted ferric reductase
MSLHKILGLAIYGMSAIHILAHAIRRSVAFFSQESLTGIGMLTLITLPIGSMYLVRKAGAYLNKIWKKATYYSQFLIPHQLGWWGLISIYGLHTKDQRLLSWGVGILSLFSFDRFWEWSKSANVRVKDLQKIHDKMIVLELEKPRHYRYQAGEKTYLSYPPNSAFLNHLHPFTLASSPDENILRFVMSDLGEWSHHVIQDLKPGDIVRIGPAFPSSLDPGLSKDKESERLFITSGSGLAVTLAHLHDDKEISPISIIHTSRYREEFALLNQHMKNNKLRINKVRYYDTSQNYQSKLRSMHEPPNASTCAGRFEPQNNPMLKQFKGKVYFCGNDLLGDELEKTVKASKDKVLFREKFNF